MFMVKTFYDLSKGSLTNDFNQLESVGNMVTFLDTVVSLFIVKAIIDKSLHIWWFNFLLILAKVVAVIVVINFSCLESSKILLTNHSIALNLGYIYREFDVQIICLVDSQFISFRGLGDDGGDSVRLLPLTCRVGWLNLLHVSSVILRAHWALLLTRGCNPSSSLTRIFKLLTPRLSLKLIALIIDYFICRRHFLLRSRLLLLLSLVLNLLLVVYQHLIFHILFDKQHFISRARLIIQKRLLLLLNFFDLRGALRVLLDKNSLFSLRLTTIL